MFSLILYAALAVGALVAIHGFDVSRQNIGRDKQIALDKPVIEAAEKGRDTAVAANAQLQSDLATLDAQRKACSDQVDKLAAQSAVIVTARAVRKPRDDAQLAAISPEKEALIAALGLPVSGTCEQRMARRDAALARAAAQRQRDFPQMPAAPAPTKDTLSVQPTNPLTTKGPQ